MDAVLTAVQSVTSTTEMGVYSTEAELSSEYARLMLADLRQGRCHGVSVSCSQGGCLAGLKTRAEGAARMHTYHRAAARPKSKILARPVAEDVALCAYKNVC